MRIPRENGKRLILINSHAPPPLYTVLSSERHSFKGTGKMPKNQILLDLQIVKYLYFHE